MKLNDILQEGIFSRKTRKKAPQGFSHGLERRERREPMQQRGSGKNWQHEMKFKKQADIFKRFLRRFPINELASIYSNALNSGRFSPEELNTVRKAMAQRRWPEDEVNFMRT